eukprot:5659236-Alexandrium_andersonii.AAC.1
MLYDTARSNFGQIRALAGPYMSARMRQELPETASNGSEQFRAASKLHNPVLDVSYWTFGPI